MTTTKTSKTAKTFACALACAATLSGALFTAAPTPAMAATRSAITVSSKTTVTHYNGQSVVIPTGNGTSVQAEWYKIGNSWKAVFGTQNGTKIYATQKSGKWSFAAQTKKGSVAVMRTKYESTKVGKRGPKGLSSHWRATNANVWY